MDRLAHYLNPQQAQEALGELAEQMGTTEFAQVRNLDYVPAPYELYPLAPRTPTPMKRITAFAVDMDGTSTTTEPLALHSLEYMVRRFTNRMTKAEWPGLDPVKDHPYVIGNSNFRHTEFLVERYRDALDHEALKQAYFEAVLWTLACMDDPQRRRDIAQNARNVGLGEMLADEEFKRLTGGGTVSAKNAGELAHPLVSRFGQAFRYDHLGELVSAALDIYYYRYHAIMRKIEAGAGEQLSHELLGEHGRRLIEPMPGYEVFVPMVKGWLGPEIDALYERLREHLLADASLGHTATQLDALRPRLVRLAERFRSAPAKIGLVTASIAYETHACMKEVIRVMAEDVQNWPLAAEHKDGMAAGLADYRAVYDGFVCATDACEPRLKPHRDLYSLALFQMSVSKQDYPFCMGIEDTEPGVIALRAAGIGCAIALPNHDTSRQDYSAATEVVRGGLPELMLVKNLLLEE
ncbi:MAG: hypothetical protein JXO22_02490 [Phycisphaerae bacterium]|nr:hypothetical protein [Phycisphaerae bacterium]